MPDAVGIADASAEAAIAAVAMLNGAVADPEAAGEAAGAGVVGAVTTAIADGSSGTSGVESVAAPMSEVCPDLASAGSSEVFPDFVCFDGFAAAGCEFSPAALLSAFRGESDGAVAASGAVSRGGSRSWREAQEENCGGSRRSVAVGREGSALASTIAAKPLGCDGASEAEGRGGSDRTDELALDSDATLNTGTSARETRSSPARNRPTLEKQKIITFQ
ncbi:MAG: hypothetical protein WBA48_00125 [Xanthobacteraceae bacterium]